VKQPFRVAIAGLGFGAAVHVPGFRTLPGVEVVAIAGRTKAKSEEVACKLGIPAGVGSYEELLNFAPDAVSIALPPQDNGDAAAFFLAHRIPVLCEKPVAGTLSAARKLLHLSGGVTHAVNFQFAELAAFQAAKGALAEERIGEIKHVHVTWLVESYANRNTSTTWKRDAERFGGVMTLLAPHIFYLAKWLTGPISTISAHLSTGGTNHDAGKAASDTLQFWGKLQNGATLTVAVSNAAPGCHLHCWQLVGTDGTVVIENKTTDYMSGFTTTLNDRIGSRILFDAMDGSESDGRILPFASLAQRFISAIALQQQAFPTFQDGVDVQCAVEAAMHSHKTRKIVGLTS